MADERQVGDAAVAARWALVTPHREHMLAVARHRCATAEDAEDCVQEAMLRVAQFDDLDPARVEALLTSIVSRLAVDMHRARERARRYQPRLVHVPEQEPPPDEAALDAGEAIWLAAQVKNLPEREREVFRQRAAGYSAGEAATRLSLSYKSVESAYTRARGRMRMWAAAGSLVIADLLRRLRERPTTALTALAMVSAGLIVVSSLPGHASRDQDGPRPAAGAAPHVLRDEILTAIHGGDVSTAAPGRAVAPPSPRAARATRGQPAPGAPHTIFHEDVPVTPDHTAFLDLTSSDTQGGLVDEVVTCIKAQPYYQDGSAGCPPR